MPTRDRTNHTFSDWAHMPASDVPPETLSSPTSTEQLSVSPLSPQPTYQSVRPHQNPLHNSTSDDSRADDAQATHSFGQEWAFTNDSHFEDAMHNDTTIRHFDSCPSTPSRPNAETLPVVVTNQPPHG